MVQRTRFGKFLWCGLVLASAVTCGTNGAPPAHCTSEAGIDFRGMYVSGEFPPNWTCDDIQHAETIMAQELPQFDSSRLKGYQLWVMDRNTKTDQWGREVAGYTLCESKTIVVWDTDVPRTGSMAHEIGHALQNCKANLPLDPQWGKEWWAPTHSDWYREGIFLAITKAEAP